jgi:hypothetical protein
MVGKQVPRGPRFGIPLTHNRWSDTMPIAFAIAAAILDGARAALAS